MKILFIAGYGPIIGDVDKARDLYIGTLNLPLEEDTDHYFHTDAIEGAKHFALWPLSQAAQSCFGKPEWPKDLPTPTAWVEFDVEDLDSATKELQTAGYHLLIALKEEPWGQTVTRFLSPENILIGLTYTPVMR